MNQINLEKLLIQTQTSKADAGSLKLLVAQIYQAQVQQLSDGTIRLQLPQPGGALQLNMPASAAPQLQPLLALASPAQTGAATVPVLLQFQPLADGRIQLTLQHNAVSASIPLNAAELRQVLLLALQQVVPTQTTPAGNSATIAIPAVLIKQPAGLTLHIANTPGVVLPPSEQQQLTKLLNHDTNKSTVQLLLQLAGGTDKLSLALGITPQATVATPMPVQLTPTSQNTIIQQLIRLFNQQQLPAQTIAPLLASNSKLPAILAGQSAQLNWPVTTNTTPQLQLLSPKTSLQIVVQPEQFNRQVQLSLPPSASADDSSATTIFARAITQPAAAQQAVQHAWRQLLPLLPLTPAALASVPELPEPVQQIFQLLRRSQVDGNKVLTPAQLQPQLAAALAFQPLQNATPATSSGTLAVAIQLLLGQLLQKPATPAQAAPQIARFINQLDPAQASTALRQLASHSSTLQQSQLATLDSSNSQQLILQLPLQQGQQSQFCQLLLEQREAEGKQQGEKRNLWQLTMRFDLQQYGAMLVVAKLTEQQLKLQFYTEQLAAKQQAERFLPILKDRCNMQGIKVEHVECVLGKIPDTLVPRANSLLAIKA